MRGIPVDIETRLRDNADRRAEVVLDGITGGLASSRIGGRPAE